MKHVNGEAPHRAIRSFSVCPAENGTGEVYSKRPTRTVASKSGKPTSLRHEREVMEIVARALSTPDPHETVRQALIDTQAAQQSRFLALPLSAREDEWIQMRHGEVLRLNEVIHTAALNVLQSLSNLNTAMPPVQ
jgi:hypothetical protein